MAAPAGPEAGAAGEGVEAGGTELPDEVGFDFAADTEEEDEEESASGDDAGAAGVPDEAGFDFGDADTSGVAAGDAEEAGSPSAGVAEAGFDFGDADKGGLAAGDAEEAGSPSAGVAEAQAQDLDDGDDDAPAMFTAAGAAIADDFLGFGSPPAVAADGAASYSEGDGASATEFDDAAKTPADTYAASTAGGEEARQYEAPSEMPRTRPISKAQLQHINIVFAYKTKREARREQLREQNLRKEQVRILEMCASCGSRRGADRCRTCFSARPPTCVAVAALAAKHRPEWKETALRNLRETMRALRESKRKHDERCDSLYHPRQTMEQHLYSFLCHRAGHKGTLQKKVLQLFEAIEMYSPRLCEVAVFGKILQNRLDEAYLLVQDALRRTVRQLLIEQYGFRYPYTLQPRVEAAWKVSVTSDGVPYEDCVAIVRHIYDERDSEVVVRRLARRVKALSATIRGGEALSPEGPVLDFPALELEVGGEPPVIEPGTRVRYQDFLQLILRFQMELRESFLADFLPIFREVDDSDYGVISAAQMSVLINRLTLHQPPASPGGCGEGGGEGGGEQEPDVPPSAMAELETARAKAEATLSAHPRSHYTFSDCVELLADLISVRAGVRSNPGHFDALGIVEEATNEDGTPSTQEFMKDAF